MAEPVLDGLADHRRDAGDSPKNAIDLFSHLESVAPRINGDLDLGVTDRLGVLVTFSATSST